MLGVVIVSRRGRCADEEKKKAPDGIRRVASGLEWTTKAKTTYDVSRFQAYWYLPHCIAHAVSHSFAFPAGATRGAVTCLTARQPSSRHVVPVFGHRRDALCTYGREEFFTWTSHISEHRRRKTPAVDPPHMPRLYGFLTPSLYLNSFPR